ncbi:MAG: type II 3-dehydroquinate dehydratase [Deltaproteobacteria bacterium]|nr:type II 3-dehydroquinate dehydratase [Deltaproteobacteria bacterium]
MAKSILIINGPNLNMLGKRELNIYGATTLEQINNSIQERAIALDLNVICFQSNNEGELVDKLQQAGPGCDGIIINPAAYTHTSVAIRDALAALNKPTIEIHLSNIFKREDFRKHSYISDIAFGVISGLGANGYILALDALKNILES